MKSPEDISENLGDSHYSKNLKKTSWCKRQVVATPNNDYTFKKQHLSLDYIFFMVPLDFHTRQVLL
jgi:hypothetical protein